MVVTKATAEAYGSRLWSLCADILRGAGHGLSAAHQTAQPRKPRRSAGFFGIDMQGSSRNRRMPPEATAQIYRSQSPRRVTEWLGRLRAAEGTPSARPFD